MARSAVGRRRPRRPRAGAGPPAARLPGPRRAGRGPVALSRNKRTFRQSATRGFLVNHLALRCAPSGEVLLSLSPFAARCSGGFVAPPSITAV